jgi:hypothetical protein
MSCYRISLRGIVGRVLKFKFDKKTGEELINETVLEREIERAKHIGYEAWLIEKNESVPSFIRMLNKNGNFMNPVTDIMVMEG